MQQPPFQDEHAPDAVPLARAFSNTRELELVDEVLRSGVLDCGPMLDRFEQRFAHVVEARHAIATTSAVTAMQLVAATAGWGSGDDIVQAPFGTVSPATLARTLGVTSTLVDADANTLGTDLDSLEAAIGDRTRGIIAVDALGWPVDVDTVARIVDGRDIVAIVDVAGALGAATRSSLTRLFTLAADVEVTTGTGAVLCTDDDALADAWRDLSARDALDCRLGDVPAAVGLAQLERLPRTIALRELVSAEYARLLRDVPGLTLPPVQVDGAARAWPRYWVLVDPSIDRDAVVEALRLAGIETRLARLEQPPGEPSQLPVASDVAARALALPCFPQLSPQQQERVVAALVDALETT